MTPQTTTKRVIQRICFYPVLAAVFLVFILTQPSVAQTSKIVSLDTTVNLNQTGDAEIKQNLSLPLQPYQALKQEIGNPVRLMRRMHDQCSWNQIEEMKGEFEELNNSVRAGYCHLGYSRSIKPGSWLIDLSGDEEPKLVTTHDNVAIFNSVSDTELGPMTIIHRIHTPKGSSNLRFDDTKRAFSYDFMPNVVEGKQDQSSLELDCKPQLMSSLAKLYGNDQFDAFWAARSVFRNSGNATLTNYRVRFRVDGFSGWSSWKKSAMVYPGQTVVDAFYPVLDLEKLAGMTGSRPALVHCEYEYKVNGETKKETDAARLQLTSRNEVVYSSRPDGQNLDWYEQNDLAEYILAAFATSQDPAMQQLAGAVSGMAGGVAASNDNEQAIQFLEAFWDYLVLNKVAYHTPPGWSINGYFGQHVKYGRDVIRNRAGTCIDLSILWASVAKSVGLKAHIALVWGHAYPVIELPQGELLPIESTMLGKHSFQEAVNVGFDNLASPQGGLLILADIQSLEAAGVRSLDLPKLDDNFLTKLGYHTNRPDHSNSSSAGQPLNSPTNENSLSPSQVRQKLIGAWLWALEIEIGKTVVIVTKFAADGSYSSTFGTIENDQFIEGDQTEGKWSIHGNTLTLELPDTTVRGKFAFEEDSLILIEGSDTYQFHRMEE